MTTSGSRPTLRADFKLYLQLPVHSIPFCCSDIFIIIISTFEKHWRHYYHHHYCFNIIIVIVLIIMNLAHLSSDSPCTWATPSSSDLFLSPGRQAGIILLRLNPSPWGWGAIGTFRIVQPSAPPTTGKTFLAKFMR